MQARSIERDPETLWGPLLLSFTCVVRGGSDREAETRNALLAALASHDRVEPLLRLTATALARGQSAIGAELNAGDAGPSYAPGHDSARCSTNILGTPGT